MDFNAILVEGLFYEQAGAVCIEQDNGQHTTFDDVLGPVVGHRVQLALHHLPPHGIEPGKPGAGSCRFPGGVGCPVHHDRFPNRLLSFHMDGVLQSSPWRLEKFDGSVQPLPVNGMIGHYGRLGAATMLDVDKMRETLAKMSPEDLASTLASSGMSAGDLEDVLTRLRGVKG